MRVVVFSLSFLPLPYDRQRHPYPEQHRSYTVPHLTSGAAMPPPVNDSVPTFSVAEYVQTQGTGNRVSRKAVILGTQNIVLGGKCIIHSGAIIRGDLKRRDLLADSESLGAKDAGSQQPQRKPAQAPSISVSCGRYCTLGENCVIRPAYKTYKGCVQGRRSCDRPGHIPTLTSMTVLRLFSFYSVRMGDHVHIGAGSIVESGVIGNHIDIGRGCILGKLSILKDCIRIMDGAVIPAGTVLASGTVWAGSPGEHQQRLYGSAFYLLARSELGCLRLFSFSQVRR